MLGGNLAPSEDRTFVVAIADEKNPTKILCPGSLISISHVLTSTKCFAGSDYSLKVIDNSDGIHDIQNITHENQVNIHGKPPIDGLSIILVIINRPNHFF